MYVRLAFAVAAHLEPEILIVDEVLAVGDAEFQKKCLGKMKDVAGGGRTVLFVSHNMGAVQALCSSGIVLDKGTVDAIGTTHEAISKYVETVSGQTEYNLPRNTESIVDIYSARVSVEIGEGGGGRVCVRARAFAARDIIVSIDVRIKGANGTSVAFATASQLDPDECIGLIAGENEIEMCIDAATLCDGRYVLSLAASLPKVTYLQVVEDCLSFDLARDPGGLGRRMPQQSWGLGAICLPSSVTVGSTQPIRTAAQRAYS
jgi:lipopolysaccharide transport system ATP-binding protein